MAADLKSFKISHDNKVLWNDNPIAELRNNSDSIIPNIFLISDDNLSITNKKRLYNKLNNWIAYYLKKKMPGLIKLNNKKLKPPLSAIQSIVYFHSVSEVKRFANGRFEWFFEDIQAHF